MLGSEQIPKTEEKDGMYGMMRNYRKNRRKLFIIYLAFFLIFSYTSMLDCIPDCIRVEKGKAVTLGNVLPVTKTVKSSGGTVASFSSDVCCTYELECRLFGLIPIKDVTVSIVDETQVIPCGVPMGIYIETAGILVADFGEIETRSGSVKCPAKHILKKGDYILTVNGKKIEEKEDLIEAVNESGAKEVTLTVNRNGEKINCKVQPAEYREGEYRIGVWVRDDLAGIGTMTYVTENGNYGALGHGISDVDTEHIVQMKKGSAYLTDILSIVKGEKGAPGELVGQIQYDSTHRIGTIDCNTDEGIFGTLEKVPERLNDTDPISAGYKQEIKNGPAQILFEVDGETKKYEIEIDGVDMNASDANKSIRFLVIDERLLEKTGGIVQGMSGSPIIQDGKLVGAVTHVLVNDPTRGYGIFIENMLEH